MDIRLQLLTLLSRLKFQKRVLLINSLALRHRLFFALLMIFGHRLLALSMIRSRHILSFSLLLCIFFIPLLLLGLMHFQCLRVLANLSPDRIVDLGCLSVHESHLVEHFSHLPQTIDLTDVVSLTVKELSGSLLDFDLLLLAVVPVSDVTSVSEGVVHSKLLLKLLDFVFVTLNQKVRVGDHINLSLILNLHHPSSEFES